MNDVPFKTVHILEMVFGQNIFDKKAKLKLEKNTPQNLILLLPKKQGMLGIDIF